MTCRLLAVLRLFLSGQGLGSCADRCFLGAAKLASVGRGRSAGVATAAACTCVAHAGRAAALLLGAAHLLTAAALLLVAAVVRLCAVRLGVLPPRTHLLLPVIHIPQRHLQNRISTKSTI